MAYITKFGAMLALASTAMAAPIDRELGARSPMGSPHDHLRSARSGIEIAPIPFECRGDRGTFNPFPNFGTVCSSYAKGGPNQDFCYDDKDDLFHFAYEVCSECGKCVTPAPPVEYQKLGDGYCRTPAGTAGDYIKLHYPNEYECRDKCSSTSSCVGYEYQQHKNVCEIHKATISTVQSQHSTVCFKKKVEVCVGDRKTFNPFPQADTVCSSYAEGGTNRDFCRLDKDAHGRSAAEVCSECGACSGPTRSSPLVGTWYHEGKTYANGASCAPGDGWFEGSASQSGARCSGTKHVRCDCLSSGRWECTTSGASCVSNPARGFVTPVTPTPDPTPGCKFEQPGTDYWGNDLANVDAADASACSKLCLAHHKCSHFTYHGKWGCYLKHSGAGYRKKAGYTSGTCL